jgi:hypothetical protein
VDGLLFPVDNVHAAASAARRLLLDQPLRYALIESGRRTRTPRKVFACAVTWQTGLGHAL